MKNFTNNFKQFTSRLSARWLIMALMMLVGTSSAWAATIYFDNSNTKWTNIYLWVGESKENGGDSNYSSCGNSMKHKCGNIYYIDINWNGATEISFTNTSWGDEGNSICHRYGWLGGEATHIYKTSVSDANGKVFKASTSKSVAEKNGAYCNCSIGNNKQSSKTFYEFASVETYSESMCCTAPTKDHFTYTAPSNLVYNGQAKAATVTWKSGTGSGTITKYYKSGSGSYSTTAPTNVGTYTVAVKTVAGGNYCATNDYVEVGTFTITCLQPVAANFNYTAPNDLVYNGQAKSATVAWKQGTGTGNITIYYKSTSGSYTTTAPTNVGTYTVAVKTAAGGNYCATSDYVEVGTFTITCAKPIADNFIYTAPANLVYNGQAKSATVAWKQGTGTGNITIYYKSTSGSYTTTAPSAAGAYTVAVKTVAGGNYCATDDYVQVGTFTITCPGPAAPTFKVIEDEIIKCNSNTTQVGRIQITNYSAEYDYKINNQDISKASIEEGGYVNISVAGTYALYAINECDGKTASATLFTIKELNITPTISGETFAQPGKQNKIELTVPDGITAKWSVSPEADLSVSEGNSTMFSAEKNGRYTITATNGTCSATHEVTVADAFYVYFRAPKEGEETTQSKDAWYQFYYPNENSEQYRGGAMYYGESDAMPTSATLQNFNKGGKTAEIIFTDCDDYTWYGFKASAEVIAGTKYFYVHATNDKGLNGCHTHTKPQKLALTGDIYYTLGDNGSCYDGWAVNKVLAPYAGPKVYASGSTALGTNKFAALYVTDCSGKEITGYQWYKDGVKYVSKCEYTTKDGVVTGDAGETNNIRPDVAGNYSCTVKYEDGSTVTSEPVQVTGSYTHASSTLPVIIVNTNGVGFPVNNTCQTPSAHADDMKEKVSVDVKIYDGNTMVYDRKARMNYRGSSSLNFLKKSYAFCPGKDNCVEDKGRLDYVKTEKMNMLGIGTAKDKDWVLYAAAADPSLMRNRLMFDTFRDMTGGWSVNSRYVELYVDGEYKGVYVMMDKVTKNEGRVNITDPNGFIVKFDKTDLVDRYEADGDKKTFKSLYSGYDGESGNGMGTYDTFIDQRFEIEYPEMEDVEEDNPGMWAKTVNDIKTLFNNFESNLKAGNYAEVQKIIDYISWADWFIISEYAKNMDAYRASCLFVYDGGKIEARPLWDQELSFNNQCANLCSTYGCNSTTGLLIENSKIYEEGCAAPFWFTGKYVGGRGTEAKSGAQFEGYLLNDPCFIAVLKERWALHTATGGALTQDVMNAKISGYEKDLGSVGTSGTPLYRERNTYWSGKSRKTIDKANSGGTCFTGETGYQDTEISTSISAMKNWITGNRRTNLGTLITNMKGSPLSISFEPQEVTTTPWEPITLQVVNTSSYDYTITYTDGELDKQSGVIINKTDDTFKINVPRPDKWGIGNEKVEGERADITYGIKATLNVADGTTVCGKSEVTPATATIILKDEDNEDCD